MFPRLAFFSLVFSDKHREKQRQEKLKLAESGELSNKKIYKVGLLPLFLADITFADNTFVYLLISS